MYYFIYLQGEACSFLLYLVNKIINSQFVFYSIYPCDKLSRMAMSDKTEEMLQE
jgi:hypothetical protein